MGFYAMSEDIISMNTDYCAKCGAEHDYMSGPCEKCGSRVFTKEKPQKKYGVYKTYKDGACNDSPYIAIFEDEGDAKKAVEVLEKLRHDDRRDMAFACNEGWEFRCYWTYEEVPAPKTFDEFMTHINETLEECDG